MVVDGEEERTSEGFGVHVRCDLFETMALSGYEGDQDGVRTSGWDWHLGLCVVPPRGRSSTWMTSIERSLLVLSLSFTILSLIVHIINNQTFTPWH